MGLHCSAAARQQCQGMCPRVKGQRCPTMSPEGTDQPEQEVGPRHLPWLLSTGLPPHLSQHWDLSETGFWLDWQTTSSPW